ncbi:16S rRNA (uracil(1498)-N(3))-methyltransferase [Subtercola lobariae]|uniref:Ribosomal RNA small subunit methyltransferase E n=1 Tax=Subtercola lobariae TaxID=1588641 RepID=A0A917BHX7_9MICO|nr:16S rRNA (uracil(1498)-N(3))-methyltransferase [Subtercola lobariae]GGF40717.1 ribosomal RNA small subunit methyltransferase E [Subtercola lobariae]
MSSLYLRDDLRDIPHDVSCVVSLHGDEQKHAVKVNRMRVGEETSIGDGRGLLVRGPVIAVSATVLSIAVTQVIDEPVPELTIWLVQALAKGDRDELAVQTATELGVNGVVPWAAERSVVRWAGDKVAKGVERWRTIVREATKQSIRAWVPEVAGLHSTKDLLALASSTCVLVLEPTAEVSLSDVDLSGVIQSEVAGAGVPQNADQTLPDIVLVVGPEGGISERELDDLTKAGATAVKLGEGILRTSTAGPAALVALNVLLKRW